MGFFRCITVNTCYSEGDYDYYKFSGTDDYVDDSYADCAFVPTTDAQSQIPAKCEVTFDSGPESEGSEEQYTKVGL